MNAVITENMKLLIADAIGSETDNTFMKYNGTTEAYTSAVYGLLNYPRVLVGDGTTSPEPTDYCMEHMLSNLTHMGDNMVKATSRSNNMILIVTSTYKNETNATITVKELGLIGWSSSTDVQSGLNTSRMFAHQLIDPVDIEPDELYAFTMQIG